MLYQSGVVARMNLWGELCCGLCCVVNMVCSGVVPIYSHDHMQVCHWVQNHLLHAA